ncbi:PEP/pyruvate-binding domain-containing protein [Ureibacillus manganicus]|uniref:Phosphoenolpyruvate synthase n=1 Tax=Ureibacillus manganicus DSM 26584 TaxID=1384049 RepID=A0A0A3I413_9BACL|nr:PEP/pyruvate-binding domain-containing protein [Ureibacillus manganicus]KGR77403.1 hypothetical protein CD29_15155 [Ureibacillus manganicus DSM 26584]
MKKYISTFQEQGSTQQDGGKGHNLKVLTHSGFNVPEGLVLHANFYQEHYEKPTAFNYSDTEKLLKQCEEMQTKVKIQALPSALIEEIKRHTNPNFLYAVRSSSTFEDLEGSAFAGQHETFLNVSVDKLEDKIKDCFASLWNMHAVVYRNERGFSQEEASMAVVIQKMVPSESAGVAFSVDPISGKFSRVLIESSFGLGENVVAGEALTDTWIVDTKNNTVKENLADEKASLTKEEVLKIANLAKQIERHYASPQDIEWAIYEGEIYLLQSRPQTTIPAYLTRDESAERFPDAITPLTWDFVEEGFNSSLEYSLKLMNIDLPTKPWFAMKNGFVYGNQTAVEILAMKRPLKISKLQEIALLDEKYFWAESLAKKWRDDLSLYLTRIGELNILPKESDSLETFREYYDRLFYTANEYFKPNIAISMTQSFIVGTLFEALYHVYGDQQIAKEKLDNVLSLANIRTANINAELASIEDRSLTNSEFILFLEKYGHRELTFDYYYPTWAEKPEVLMELVIPCQTNTQSNDVGIDTLKELLSVPSDDISKALYKLANLAIIYTELDDEEHFQTTRVNLLARKSIARLGSKLGLEDPYDLFFLTKNELFEVLNGNEVNERGLIEKRKEYQKLLKTSPDWNYSEQEEEEVYVTDGILKGVPGSAGMIEGEVCIVRSIEEFKYVREGSILVTRTTNPAWTTLFYSAKGLITESGGPLSHGAVTAREVGIPAVMSVRNCLTSLKNGDIVIVDGTRGTVTIKEN